MSTTAPARPPAAPGPWRTTSTLGAGAAAGIVLLALGLVLGRSDVALLGVPALLGAAWGWTRRPDGPVTVEVHDEPGAAPGMLAARLRVGGPPGAETARVRVVAPGGATAERVLALTDAPRDLAVRTRSARTGALPPFRADLLAYGPDGVEEQGPVTTTGPPLLVLPRPAALARVPISSRLRGLAGPHTSRRPGDGTELRDVAPFGPGDSARRVDWRATARRSPELDTLYVRRTVGTAEATVVLVVDSRDDVGSDLTTWGGSGAPHPVQPTSLDLARHAAASVAQAVLDAGDRVALDDLGRLRRPVRPGGGRRHLRRVLHGLALARPVGEPSVRVRAPQVPAGAAVHLFSTLLDDGAPRLALQWHDAGHVVVVVDVLPPVSLADAEPRVVLAWRIARREREDRVAALRTAGIDVVRWVPHTPGRHDARLGPSAAQDDTLGPAAALDLAAHARLRDRRPAATRAGAR
ncbi:DUF58 domain-containing protein [Cellulosimicrobium sp. CUA-896]|uniref:DUF58 domain-containing protein n=1 Tax=Cellulosimicrobium sp. CUA-896 TaxID=1517881 RepID=UPI00095C4CE3|nr:DUF58 domain-containing protein [Cellulosimicrobium sp. CUA-896]OLT52441.1 hypothetical protein BJF88_13855 [Cellulosimicrobium sp. CUA-896]